MYCRYGGYVLQSFETNRSSCYVTTPNITVQSSNYCFFVVILCRKLWVTYVTHEYYSASPTLCPIQVFAQEKTYVFKVRGTTPLPTARWLTGNGRLEVIDWPPRSRKDDRELLF